MAINDSKANKGTGSAPAPSAAPTAAPQAAPQAQRSFGMSAFRTLISRNGDAAGAGKFAESFRNIITENGDALQDYKILVLDNQKFGVLLSCVLVTKAVQAANGRTCVVVHTMVVACSAGRLPKRIIQVGNGQSLELESVPGDAKDVDLWDKVKQCVYISYGQGVDVLNAGMSVIPTSMKWDDRAICTSAICVAAESVHRVSQEAIGQAEIFTVGMIPQGEQLTARVDPAPGNIENEVGLPIRSDIAVQLTGIDKSNGNASIFSNKEVSYTTVDGFVDLMYVQPEPPMPGYVPDLRQYLPVYRITKLTSDLGAMTLELMLFALYSATVLNQSRTWGMAFRQKVARDNPLRDLGAIGWEVPALTGDPNQPGQLPVANASFTIEQLDRLITDSIRDNLLIQLDVDEAGPDSWLIQILVEAAQGKGPAIDRVLMAAQNLCNGQFMQFYKPDNQRPFPFMNVGNRLIKGWYGPDTAKRPVDDIDYLAMLNMFGPKGRVDAVAEWDRTNADEGGPLEMRLEKRTRMLRDVLEDSMNITGYARPVLASPELLYAIGEGLAQAGLSIAPANIATIVGNQNRRMASTVTGAMLDPRRAASGFSLGRPQFGGGQLNGMGNGWGL